MIGGYLELISPQVKAELQSSRLKKQTLVRPTGNIDVTKILVGSRYVPNMYNAMALTRTDSDVTPRWKIPFEGVSKAFATVKKVRYL